MKLISRLKEKSYITVVSFKLSQESFFSELMVWEFGSNSLLQISSTSLYKYTARD